MTSHPPDEYTQQARELLQTCGVVFCAVEVAILAAALRARDEAAYQRGAEEMREQAKGACRELEEEERNGAEKWREQGLADRSRPRYRAASALGAAADAIAALPIAALPTDPAAPEGEPLAAYIAENPAYTIEPHGDGEALYLGRDDHHHGLNIANIVEPDPTRWPEVRARILAALNAAADFPCEVCRDSAVGRTEDGVYLCERHAPRRVRRGGGA